MIYDWGKEKKNYEYFNCTHRQNYADTYGWSRSLREIFFTSSGLQLSSNCMLNNHPAIFIAF